MNSFVGGQLFQHGDAERSAALAHRSKSFALIEAVCRISLVDIQCERFVTTSGTDEQLVEERTADTGSAMSRCHRNGNLRGTVTAGAQWQRRFVMERPHRADRQS